MIRRNKKQEGRSSSKKKGKKRLRGSETKNSKAEGQNVGTNLGFGLADLKVCRQHCSLICHPVLDEKMKKFVNRKSFQNSSHPLD
jgi:hypothetical protein